MIRGFGVILKIFGAFFVENFFKKNEKLYTQIFNKKTFQGNGFMVK